jgi:hypothetical protein
MIQEFVTMENLTIIVAAISAIGAIVAAIVAVMALNRMTEIARAQLFVDLRRSHAETQAKMDVRYHDETWDPRIDPEAMGTLQRYWLHTTTEWFATTRLNEGRYSDIWNSFYIPAITGGLRNKPLRIALWEMLYGKPGSSFSGFRKQFGATIEEIYKGEYHQEFRDSL